jgi:hypothetical protein
MACPPRLPDAAIHALIEELRAQHGILTGTRLRDELARRHGLRCGVSRIYRLLHQTTHPRPAPDPAAQPQPAGDVADLQAQLAAALERARLAEHREEHHQTRWANEIHALREQVRTHLDASHRLKILEGELQDRSRELTSAYLRMSDLETKLRTLEEG